MGFYDKYLLPQIVQFTCSMKPNMLQRKLVVPRAEGVVLEIGIGTGLNLPFYTPEKIKKVLGLDPSLEMTKRAKKVAETVSVDVEFIEMPGEEIPLDDDSVDTVLMTYTLCSIVDTKTALHQMARVLKPGGKLIFCEHGAAPDISIRQWQDRLDPVWGYFGGGCHLNRDIPKLINEGGFNVINFDEGYIKGWRPASYNYWGTASRV